MEQIFFLKNISWIKLLEEIGVDEIIKNNNNESYINSNFIIRNNKNRYFESRMPLRVFDDFQFQWDEFKDMSSESKKAIIAAINDNDLRMMPPFRDITYKYIEKESDILMEVSLDEIECKQV